MKIRFGFAVMITLALAFAQNVQAAKTTSWTASGGGNFNDEDNWDNGVPAEGDTVNLVANGVGIVFNNDITGLSISSLTVSGTATSAKPCQVRGEGITLTSYTVNTSVASYVPLASTSSLTLQRNGTSAVAFEIYAPVSVTNNLYTLTGSSMIALGVGLHGDVTVGGEINPWGNMAARYYANVKAGRFYYGRYWTGAEVSFENGTIDVDDMDIGAAKYTFYTSDALVPTTVITWKGLSDYIKGSVQTSGRYFFDCATMTIDRLHCDVVPVLASSGNWNDYYVIGTSSANTKNTLTMKATASDVSYAKFINGLSIVYDPQGDFTLTCSNSVHTMDGTITVKGGTLAFNGATTLANVTAVNVDGGTFELDSTTANALSGVTALKVADGATFSATGAASAPFAAAGIASIEISGSGKLVLGTGVNFTAKIMRVAGDFPAAGTYTGVGHASEGVKEASWIDGAGRVTVDNSAVTSWKNAVSGGWSDSTKWSNGVPTRDKPAYICASGASYTVTVSGGTMPASLEIGNQSGVATLKVEDATFSNASITLGKGGRIEVPENGTFLYKGEATGSGTSRQPVAVAATPTTENAMIKIQDGGTFAVTGGSAVFTNFLGYIAVGGMDGSAGTMAVSAGELQFFRNNPLDRIVVYEGGEMDFSGTGVFSPSGIGCVIGVTGKAANPGIVYSDTASNGKAQWFGGQGDTVYELNTMPMAKQPNELVIAPTYSCDSYEAIAQTQKTTVNLKDATLTVGKNHFVIAGGTPNGSIYSAYDMVGILNVEDGGSVDYDGSYDLDRMYLDGLSIGYGAFSYFNDFKRLYGELNIAEGGTFDNKNGYTSVGVSYGSGRLCVDGGTFRHGSANNMFLLGVAGGTADCVVKDGTFTVNANDAYIGGAWTNVFPQGKYLYSWGWRPNNHEAVGTFRQEGGDVAFANRVILGADGSGTIEQVGSAGTFTADTLVFSNTVLNATSGGTAKFTFDENGARVVSASEKIVIGANATLVIDSANYPSTGKGVTLFSCPGGIVGKFSSVTLEGAFARKTSLVYSETSVKLKGTAGTVIIVW